MALTALKELIGDADAVRASIGGSRETVLQWAHRAGITLRGKPYSFEGHEYLRTIMEDDHPNQTFEKAAQVGISTVVLIKALYVADHLGGKCVYYFQDDGAVSDFSSDRAQPMIAESDYLMGRVRSTDRIGLKQIGAGSLFFRGLFTKGKAKSVDADFVILDELDEANQEHKEFALDRLMHSKLQWVHALSQPSFPGYGVDGEFAGTDQRFWHIRCGGCGHWNCLEAEFPANFIPLSDTQRKHWPDGATHYRGCVKCATRLDVSAGEWVAKYREAGRRGYHLSQLYTQVQPSAYANPASKIMAEWEASRGSQIKLGRFTISVLGFPYAGAAARVTDEILDACEIDTGFMASAPRAFMGVDQGDTLSILVCARMGDELHVLWPEETEDWARLDALMDRYNVAHCVVDALPNKDSAKGFAARHKGRVSIQYFTGRELKVGAELHRGKAEVATVSVDRTDSLDATVDMIERGDVGLPARRRLTGRDLHVMDAVRRHLKNLIAKTEETPSGTARRVYLKNVENHYGMALNSARIAAFELGIKAPSTGTAPMWARWGRS